MALSFASSGSGLLPHANPTEKPTGARTSPGDVATEFNKRMHLREQEANGNRFGNLEVTLRRSRTTSMERSCTWADCFALTPSGVSTSSEQPVAAPFPLGGNTCITLAAGWS